MLVKLLQNFFRKDKQKDKQCVEEHENEKEPEQDEKLMTIFYESRDRHITVVEIYYTYNPNTFKLVANGEEKCGLTWLTLTEKLKDIEQEVKPRKIWYRYSYISYCWALLFRYLLYFIRKEKLKWKIIRVFRCEETTTFSFFVLARKTEKANVVYVEVYLDDFLVQEGYVSSLFLKNLRKLEKYLEISCTLKEVKPCKNQ
jgi:hypothetical protein